eukprot:TRINITY_DN11849_c0_g1_i1.p1 TRINITY_DN11849_c0_g1~~TRINITY_DN11849_c0_g1_i1.p1  ORF type:complete len:295 (+),score=78.31 TRINITY_DN11849_c0_g1_i1:148-1032(+)
MGGSATKLKNVKSENPITYWQIQGDLGSGTYGKVHLVRQRQTGQTAAAKIATIEDKASLADFATEIEILTSCRHGNITNFMDGYYNNNDLWIIIELCDGGSLSDVVQKTSAGVTEEAAAIITGQMLYALDFLHLKHVIHRDINCSNTLVTAHGTVKLADFGVSALNKNANQTRSTFVGSPHWMAPEVVACEKDASQTYNQSADLWSLGITLMELVQRQPPYHDLHPIKVLFKIRSADPPTLDADRGFSAAMTQFLAKCLVKDPRARATASQLSKHPFCADATEKRVLAAYISSL